MATASYRVFVDWNNDGIFQEIVFLAPWQVTSPGEYEDLIQFVRANPGIRMVRGRDQIRALTPPMAGSAECELDNQSRAFSPENTSSDLYGNLIPGRKMRVQAYFSGTEYNLWTGYLDDIPQHPARNRRSVSLPALGPFSRLVGKKISTALYENITTDVAIGHVLDAVGWAAGDRTLATGKTTLLHWWLQEEDAWEALKTLLNTEGPGASLYEDEDGKIVFEDRHYRITTTRSTTSQATISDTGSEPLFSEPFAYNPGLKNIINVCTVTCKTRTTAGSYSAVWSLGQTVTLAAGEIRKYTATDDDPFTDAQTPADTTDYTVTAGSLSSVTLDRTSGQSCTITLTAGGSGATVTSLQLRAKTVTISNTVLVANTVDTSTSITKFGRQVYPLSTRAEVAVSTMQDFTNAVVSRYQDPRPTVQFPVNNETDSRMTQILSREVSDRITVVEAQTGVNHDYWVERIEHRIDAAGKYHVAQFGCEKVVSADHFVIGVSSLDSGIVGY